jgi:hypothetical protein
MFQFKLPSMRQCSKDLPAALGSKSTFMITIWEISSS